MKRFIRMSLAGVWAFTMLCVLTAGLAESLFPRISTETGKAAPNFGAVANMAPTRVISEADGGATYVYDNVSENLYLLFGTRLSQLAYQMTGAEDTEQGMRLTVTGDGITLVILYDIANQLLSVRYPAGVTLEAAAQSSPDSNTKEEGSFQVGALPSTGPSGYFAEYKQISLDQTVKAKGDGEYAVLFAGVVASCKGNWTTSIPFSNDVVRYDATLNTTESEAQLLIVYSFTNLAAEQSFIDLSGPQTQGMRDIKLTFLTEDGTFPYSLAGFYATYTRGGNEREANKVAHGVLRELTDDTAILNVGGKTPTLTKNNIGICFTVPMAVVQSSGTLAFSFTLGGEKYVLYLTRQ